jgi:hypothetical protein
MYCRKPLTNGDDRSAGFGQPTVINGAETGDRLRQQPATGVVVADIDDVRYWCKGRRPSKTCCF